MRKMLIRTTVLALIALLALPGLALGADPKGAATLGDDLSVALDFL